MKTSCIVVALLIFGAASLFAQNTVPTAQSGVPAPTAFHIVEQSGSHNVWQRETFEKLPGGQIATHVHKFTELASGLNYQDAKGNWQPSQETIQSYAGGAIANQGQHQVIFANNLNSAGAIDMQTPDGKRLQSSILGLMYHDTASGAAVLIAQIQDSTGELISPNQVLYPNAFDGVTADVRYTNRKGSFEQDVILREQPPDPTVYGMNPATTEIEVMTEFIKPPAGTIAPSGWKQHNGEADQNVSWGRTKLGRGKAFDLDAAGNLRQRVNVIRQYKTVSGAKVLLEKVPLIDIRSSLLNLPPQSSIEKKSNLPKVALETLVLPQLPLPQKNPQPIKLARTLPSTRGFVLDYVTLDSDFANFTFQGDTTYDVEGDVNLSDTTTFEGGTVIKFNTNNACALNVLGTVNFNTGAYNPAIFTSTDDGAVGESVYSGGGSASCTGTLSLQVQNNWSEDLQYVYVYDQNWDLVVDGEGAPEITAGNYNTYSFTAGLGESCFYDSYDGDWNEFCTYFNPTLVNGLMTVNGDGSVSYSESGDSLCTPPPAPPTTALSLANGGIVHDVHIGGMQVGIDSAGSYSVTNAQFVNCGTALMSEDTLFYAGNLLMSQVGTAFYGQSYSGTAEQVTFDQGSLLTDDPDGTYTSSSLTLANALLTGVGSYGVVPVTGNQVVNLSSGSGVYQVAGAGSYYLTNGSPYHNAGSTAISSSLLSELATKTTYAPLVYNGVSFTNIMTFSPQVQRDNGGNPDLGYHYDPLDYCLGGCSASTNLNFTAGTAIGWFEPPSWGNGYAVDLGFHVLLTFTGTATAPCVLARYSTVQDRSNGAWPDKGSLAAFSADGSAAGNDVSVADGADAAFAKFYGLAGDPNYFRDYSCWMILRISDSEFHSGSDGGYSLQFWMTNCLFDCLGLGIQTDHNTGMFVLQNCTMHRNIILAQHWSGTTWPVVIQNSSFDSVDFSQMDGTCADTNYCTYGHNAFIAGQQTLPVTNGFDQVVSSFNWQSSWFGNYYLPTNSPLINTGSTNANLLGLYHFTTQTSQVPETNSIVDIGYHYVATDASGNPIDTDGDGIPDYLEDSNGNGVFDTGDLSDWLVSPYNGISRTNGLSVFTPLK